jgi:hypothetical protein
LGRRDDSEDDEQNKHRDDRCTREWSQHGHSKNRTSTVFARRRSRLRRRGASGQRSAGFRRRRQPRRAGS